MPENTRITSPIEIKDNSRESVALELTRAIAHAEKLFDIPNEYRKKLLDLYAECLDATNGSRN